MFGQEILTLEDCVQIGKENSYKIMVAQLETQVVEKQKQSLASYYLPSVNLNGTQGYNYGSAIDPSSNSRVSSNIASTQLSVDAGIQLIDWSNFIEHSQHKLAIDYAKLSEQEVLYYYHTSILELFFDILGQQEYLKIQQLQLINSEVNYNRVKKEVEAGAKPQSDLYDIDYIFHSEQIAIEQTEDNLYNQKLKLLHLLNQENRLPNDFQLAFNTESIGFFSEYSFNPMLEKVRLNSELLQKDIALLKSRNLPVLSASYQFGSFYSKPFKSNLDVMVNTFSKQLGDNKNHAIGLRLSIPIFQGGSVSRSLAKKRKEIELNALKIKEQENVLSQENKEIEEVIQQLFLLDQKLKENMELSQKSFTTTQVKYENGKVDVFSFNAAKNQLLSAQFALIKNDLNRSLMSKKLQLINTNTL